MNIESSASTSVKCDNCKTILGNSSYPDKRGVLSISLNDGPDTHGYDQYNRKDYCSESCMLAHLQAQAKQAKANLEARASINKIGDHLLELDVTKAIGYKKPTEEVKT